MAVNDREALIAALAYFDNEDVYNPNPHALIVLAAARDSLRPPRGDATVTHWLDMLAVWWLRRRHLDIAQAIVALNGETT